MATRLPASQHTREELTALIEGRLSTASAKDELVKLATRLIVEQALEGEAGDALGREYSVSTSARMHSRVWPFSRPGGSSTSLRFLSATARVSA